MEERRLGNCWYNLKKKFKKYEGKALEEVEDEEDRKILEIIRRLDEEYNLRNSRIKVLQQAKQECNDAKEKNYEVRLLEEQVEEELKKRGKLHEE